MVRALKIQTADVKVIHGKKSNPVSVVQSAIDTYDKDRKFEQIYVVVDVDQHDKNLAEAKTMLENHHFA
jgi:hypothetical protein